MQRKRRTLKAGYAYHVTTRCNNREFNLSRRDSHYVFLYAIKRAVNKFNFRLYVLCIKKRGRGSDAPSASGQCQGRTSPEVSAVARQFIEVNQTPWLSSQKV
ncbi:hypothetical protein NG791_23670 [Laspinema sp. D1]|uniref:hypothetical protein n=1 Tax=Laspinema palackyanum TaxID=3231601 RepID=UPI0034749F4A|nr:hypothetical protein [Laspinema sp. D2b]